MMTTMRLITLLSLLQSLWQAHILETPQTMALGGNWIQRNQHQIDIQLNFGGFGN